MRPCGHLFQIATDARTARCSCGRESIGRCVDCGQPLCGLHGSGNDDFLCQSCQQKRFAQKQSHKEEATRNHEMGLVDVGGALGLADQSGPLPLRDLWIAVFNALKEREPPADIVVLDEHRLNELPSRWPRSQGWMRERSLAKWNTAIDRLGIPAWSTRAALRSSSGVADTFSVDSHPLYLGCNGVLYCNPARPTPNGTCAEWKASYGSPDDVPGVWSSKWAYDTPYYPRQEVAGALANLVAIHGLNLNV